MQLCAGVIGGGPMQCHLEALLKAAALPFKLAQDTFLGSLCSHQGALHLLMLNLLHLLTTHSLLTLCVSLKMLLLCCMLLHTLPDLCHQHLFQAKAGKHTDAVALHTYPAAAECGSLTLTKCIVMYC